MAEEGRIYHHDVHEARGAVTLKEFPSSAEYAFTPDQYAEYVARVRRAVGVPVIGSLNGTTAESWLTFSRLIEQAGASGLELNLYEVVADPKLSGAAIRTRPLDPSRLRAQASVARGSVRYGICVSFG